MNPLVFLVASLAGGVGAVLRWLIDVVISRRVGRTFPWGILVVNVIGSLALGIVTGAVHSSVWAFVLGAGLLGGFTTFSSVAATTALMLDEHRTRAAVINAAGTFFLSVLAALAGLAIGSAI